MFENACYDKGYNKGKNEGKTEGYNDAQMSIQDIIEITGLSEKEILALQNE